MWFFVAAHQWCFETSPFGVEIECQIAWNMIHHTFQAPKVATDMPTSKRTKHRNGTSLFVIRNSVKNGKDGPKAEFAWIIKEANKKSTRPSSPAADRQKKKPCWFIPSWNWKMLSQRCMALCWVLHIHEGFRIHKTFRWFLFAFPH